MINECFVNTIKSNCDSILLCLALQRYRESGVLTQCQAGDGDGSQARAQKERFLISIINYSILAAFLLRLLRKRCFLAVRTVRGPTGTGWKQWLRKLKCWAWKKSDALSWATNKNRLGERSGEDRVLEGLEVTVLWQTEKRKRCFLDCATSFCCRTGEAGWGYGFPILWTLSVLFNILLDTKGLHWESVYSGENKATP